MVVFAKSMSVDLTILSNCGLVLFVSFFFLVSCWNSCPSVLNLESKLISKKNEYMEICWCPEVGSWIDSKSERFMNCSEPVSEALRAWVLLSDGELPEGRSYGDVDLQLAVDIYGLQRWCLFDVPNEADLDVANRWFLNNLMIWVAVEWITVT